MKHPLKIAILGCAALALSGCGLFKGNSAVSKANRAADLAAAQQAGTYFTQLGRRELDAGRTGMALEAFERALASGEEAAPALNGMGVVYARLGRYEAAHKLFSEAVVRDPSNEKYAANLARLIDSPAFAMRHEADMTAELVRQAQAPQVDTARAETALGSVMLPTNATVDASAPASAPATSAAAPVVATATQSRLVRVGRGEFRIHSAAAQPAPVRSALNALAPRFRPQVAVAFGRSTSASQAPAAEVVEESTLAAPPKAKTIAGFKPEVSIDLRSSGKTMPKPGN